MERGRVGVKVAAGLMGALALAGCEHHGYIDNTGNSQTSMEQIIFHPDGTAETADHTYACSGMNLVRTPKETTVGILETRTFLNDAACVGDQKLTPEDVIVANQ